MWSLPPTAIVSQHSLLLNYCYLLRTWKTGNVTIQTNWKGTSIYIKKWYFIHSRAILASSRIHCMSFDIPVSTNTNSGIMSQHSNTLHPQTHMNTSGRESVGTCTCTIRSQEFRIVNWCSFQEFYCSQVSSSRQRVAGFPIEHHCRKISWLRALCWYFLKSLRMCISATAQQVFWKE